MWDSLLYGLAWDGCYSAWGPLLAGSFLAICGMASETSAWL